MEDGNHDDRVFIPGDIAGHRIGFLVAQKLVVDENGDALRVIFRCDCSRLVTIPIKNIRQGKFRDACKRCYKPERRKRKKPQRRQRCPKRQQYASEYKTWKDCVSRKARGAWATSFDKFFDDIGPRPPKRRLMKWDEKLPHSPSNSFWGFMRENELKNPVTYKGRKYPPHWICVTFGVRPAFVRACKNKNIYDAEEIVRLWRVQYPEDE